MPFLQPWAPSWIGAWSMAPRDVRPTTSCARQPVQRPDQAAVAPAPAPSARLEVIVVGGGLSGLCCAAICSKMQGKKRIRVYDRGNAKKDLRVVNLQSSTWSKFPEELQERLKTISSSQWPCQRESPRSLGRPRSLFAYQLKEELERMAQVEMHQGPPELEDPCHALVLADGPDARHLRREHFGTSAVSAASLTALGCAVSDVESDSNLATVLSCAQRRFALNLAGDAGLLSMVLTDDEIKEVQGAKGTLQKVKAWETMKEGYRLFGLSDSSIGEPVVLSTHLQGQQRYFTELNSFDAPAATIATVQHPWAFLVGEAAGLVNIWPGRALNAMVKSSLVLAQHLKAMAQAVRAGYPVDESFSMEYGEQLTKLHGFEAGVYSRQCEAAQTRSKSFRLSTCLQEAKATEPAQQVSALAIFRRTLRGSGRWLEKNEEKDEEKDEKFEEALWRGVKEANLDARTLTLFNASGSWFLDPPLSEAEPEKEKIVPEVTVQEMEAAGRSSYNRALRLYRAKQLPEAAQGFRAAALHGHGKGAYALGVMLLNGEGVKKDELSAAQFLHQAAQKGENKAMYNLALMYQHGIGLRQDALKAKEWTLRAAEKGHRKALRSKNVKIFGSGPWLDYDPKEMGVDRITKEAENGNTHAQFKLGMMHYEGDHVKLDKALASYWFMQAAQAGLDEAQYQISRMLFQGDGIEADEQYAFRFLTAAAQQGHPESMHNLGVKLYFGEGIDSDRRSAATWFLKAAEQELPEAQNNIGWMLYCGDSIPMNMEAGVAWLEKAADRGNEEAQHHLQSIRGTMITG